MFKIFFFLLIDSQCLIREHFGSFRKVFWKSRPWAFIVRILRTGFLAKTERVDVSFCLMKDGLRSLKWQNYPCGCVTVQLLVGVVWIFNYGLVSYFWSSQKIICLPSLINIRIPAARLSCKTKSILFVLKQKLDRKFLKLWFLQQNDRNGFWCEQDERRNKLPAFRACTLRKRLRLLRHGGDDEPLLQMLPWPSNPRRASSFRQSRRGQAGKQGRLLPSPVRSVSILFFISGVRTWNGLATFNGGGGEGIKPVLDL